MTRAGKVPKTFFVVGFARSKMDDRAFRERVKNSIQHAYLRLKARMEDLRTKFNTDGNLVFHVATPPSLYATIVSFLGHLSDEQIYRIDHYLGKETVQNLLMFRFVNQIFEPAWNSEYIDHVQIAVAEEIGVGHRAGYFEQAGLLRDMHKL